MAKKTTAGRKRVGKRNIFDPLTLASAIGTSRSLGKYLPSQSRVDRFVRGNPSNNPDTWIVVSKSTGKPIEEIWDSSKVAEIDRSKYDVYTAREWQAKYYAEQAKRNPAEDISLLNDLAPVLSLGHIEFTTDGLERYMRDGYIYAAYSATPVMQDGYRVGTVEGVADVSLQNPHCNPHVAEGKYLGSDGSNEYWEWRGNYFRNRADASGRGYMIDPVSSIALREGETGGIPSGSRWEGPMGPHFEKYVRPTLQRKHNPAKFDRCVHDVLRRSPGVNAYAVCTAAGTRNPYQTYVVKALNLNDVEVTLKIQASSPEHAKRIVAAKNKYLRIQSVSLANPRSSDINAAEDIVTRRTFRHYAIRLIQPGNRTPVIGEHLPNSWHPAGTVDGFEEDTELDGTAGFEVQSAEDIKPAIRLARSYWPDADTFALIGSDNLGEMYLPESGAILLDSPRVLYIVKTDKEHPPTAPLQSHFRENPAPRMVLNYLATRKQAQAYAHDAKLNGWKGVRITNTSRGFLVDTNRIIPRRNPTDASDALYESFHGAPPSETLEIHEAEYVHGHLASLGDLTEIVVKLSGGAKVGATTTLTAPDPETASDKDIVHVASNELGNQLYLVGGDQSVDVKKLGFRDSFDIKHDGETFEATELKDLMVLGEIQKLTYRTQKSFDDFAQVDYFHQLGEDTKVRPMLLYDTMNDRMKIAGGEYHVHSVGVVN
jgi:hypothetical protein